jgi:hypothetical protein
MTPMREQHLLYTIVPPRLLTPCTDFSLNNQKYKHNVWLRAVLALRRLQFSTTGGDRKKLFNL